MCLCEVGGILLGNLRSTYAPHLKVADFSQTGNMHATVAYPHLTLPTKSIMDMSVVD